MEGYAPFKMKAADYGNSPMLKNFPDAFPGGVGNSPAKGWFSNIAKKVKNIGKKVLGMSAIGKALGIGKKKKDPTAAATAADATVTTAPPHTHDESGAVIAEGAEGVQQPVAEVSAGPQSVKAIKRGPRGAPLKPGTPEHAAAMENFKGTKFGRVGVGSSVVANTGQGMWT